MECPPAAPGDIVTEDRAGLTLLERQHLVAPDADHTRTGIDNAAHATGKEHEQPVVEVRAGRQLLSARCTEAERVGHGGLDDLPEFRCDVVVARLIVAVPQRNR